MVPLKRRHVYFWGGRPASKKGVFCEKGWTFFRACSKLVSLITTIFSELERWLLLNHYVEWEEEGPTSWQKDGKSIFADALELRSGLCFFDAKNWIIEVQRYIITPLSFPLWEHVFRIAGKHRCELVCLQTAGVAFGGTWDLGRWKTFRNLVKECIEIVLLREWRMVRPNATPLKWYTWDVNRSDALQY